ncbi:hypothetical protein [Niabella aurantiaca]|uniref:hypothetical protein n=1 Tax=Niabella aurantiaca TaxID=379900 RepID=UPI0009FF8ACD|nr:hypothetical protein [Niabella aurantiaca]
MKKQWLWLTGCALLLGGIIAGCNGCKGKNGKPGADDDTSGIDISERHDSMQLIGTDTLNAFQITEANKDSVLSATTKAILTLFKNKEYAKLDSFIHPLEGIRFSPYATIEPGSDKKFSREAFRELMTTNRNKKINWGTYDGSGNAIVLSPAEYFGKFVYDGNFLSPKRAGVNTVLGKGNSVNNLRSVYPGAEFTENYLGGTKKYGGMDWKSVRLVYKLENGRYYLIAIVHDQWTI